MERLRIVSRFLRCDRERCAQYKKRNCAVLHRAFPISITCQTPSMTQTIPQKIFSPSENADVNQRVVPCVMSFEKINQRIMWENSGYKGLMPVRTLRSFPLLFIVAVLIGSPIARAQTTAEAQAIRAVLDRQVADWNRGDLDSFATGYKNSPDILFMGSKISRGYQQMLETYRKGYSTKEKMGTLNFAGLE